MCVWRLTRVHACLLAFVLGEWLAFMLSDCLAFVLDAWLFELVLEFVFDTWFGLYLMLD